MYQAPHPLRCQQVSDSGRRDRQQKRCVEPKLAQLEKTEILFCLSCTDAQSCETIKNYTKTGPEGTHLFN